MLILRYGNWNFDVSCVWKWWFSPWSPVMGSWVKFNSYWVIGCRIFLYARKWLLRWFTTFYSRRNCTHNGKKFLSYWPKVRNVRFNKFLIKLFKQLAQVWNVTAHNYWSLYMHVSKYKPLAGIWLCQLLIIMSWLQYLLTCLSTYLFKWISIFCVKHLQIVAFNSCCDFVKQSIDKLYQENSHVFNNKSLTIEYHNECFKDIEYAYQLSLQFILVFLINNLLTHVQYVVWHLPNKSSFSLRFFFFNCNSVKCSLHNLLNIAYKNNPIS